MTATERSFWSGYWQSLKSRDVEEPIDVYVHRPVAYVLARALMPTPVSPDAVTLVSFGFGIMSAALMVMQGPHHWQWAALCSFIGTVLDCVDGQLARMRKTSSVLGRMLDGTADSTVVMVVGGAAAYVLYREYAVTTPLLGALAAALTLASGVSISVQTTLFDHYKTVFMKLTVPGYREAESFAVVRRRYDELRQQPMSLLQRVVWRFYLTFIGQQGTTVNRFDPYTVTEFEILGEVTPERAAIYREHASDVMRTWRRYFGFGSLMFGVAMALLLELPGEYLLLRLTLFNLYFWGPLRWRQQEASKRAMAALGVTSAAQGGSLRPPASD